MLPEFFDIEVGACQRSLPVVSVGTDVHVAFMDIVGDMELMDAALRELLKQVPSDIEAILGGDTVGLVVAHHLALLSGLPYVVARKKRTAVMNRPLTAQATSVTSVTPSTFWLGDTHAMRLQGRHVLVTDEVMSTGSTLAALNTLATEAGASKTTLAVIATEGERRPGVISLLHLPIWHQAANLSPDSEALT
jgi:adenine phosphoribosyltransferase